MCLPRVSSRAGRRAQLVSSCAVVQDGNAADQARSGGLSKQGSMDVGAAAAAAGTPAEPSFELPNELREYQGDPDDKKGILQFRQQQQVRDDGGHQHAEIFNTQGLMNY